MKGVVYFLGQGGEVLDLQTAIHQFCMETVAVFKWDPCNSPRYGVPCCFWIPTLLSWKHWTKQHDRLPRNLRLKLPRDVFNAYKFQAKPKYSLSHNLHWATFVVQSIAYLIIYLVFIHLDVQITPGFAHCREPYFCPPPSVQISTITFYTSYKMVKEPVKLQAVSMF